MIYTLGMMMPSAVVETLNVKEALDWWSNVNESPFWQDRIFLVLSLLYGIVSLVALTQLKRIKWRKGWMMTMEQKVFHWLVFIVNGVRALVFFFGRNVQFLLPEILQHILLDLPSLAYFVIYTILILYWAEIYPQVHSISHDKLMSGFFIVNAFQISLWFISRWLPIPFMVILSKLLLAGISWFFALGFLVYGRRLFLMLQRFPVKYECKGGLRKMKQVGYVAPICFICFLVRCITMCIAAFDEDSKLVLDHPMRNFIYYLFVEIIPSSLVLFMLR